MHIFSGYLEARSDLGPLLDIRESYAQHQQAGLHLQPPPPEKSSGDQVLTLLQEAVRPTRSDTRTYLAILAHACLARLQ